MADKPEKFPEWANDNPTDPVSGQLGRVEPSQGKKDSGWTRNEIPPRQWLNWLAWKTNQWVLWFEDRVENLLGRVTQAEQDISSLEDAAGVLEVDASGSGDIDLTNANARIIHLTGTRTADGTVTFNDRVAVYHVLNETDGGFDLNVKTDTGSDEIPLVRDEFVRVWSDGSEIDASVRQTTVELGGDFDAGQNVIITRRYETVTIISESSGMLSHSSSNLPVSDSGIIPEWARPVDFASVIRDVDSSGVQRCGAGGTNNRISFRYFDWSGVDTSRTDTGTYFYIVYAVNA